jgi:glutamine amidotransferase
MCRHTAWLGRPLLLSELLVDPQHGLLRQTWEPRRQRNGIVNADGFGVGWFSAERPEPARYRRAVPMWADPSFLSFAGVVRSGCVLGAVRSATVGGPGGEEACAPFLLPGGVLLSHNGAVPVELVAPMVPSVALAAVGSTVDSALLAALVASRLGLGLAEAIGSVVQEVAAVAPECRLNLLATDGATIVGTAWGDTLFWRATDGGAVVASEPSDDEQDWTAVPDHALLRLTPDGVAVTSLQEGAP